MSNQATSTDLHNVTFSQGLEGGLTHSDWLVCPTTGKCGQDRVLASHSVLPERVKELQMSATSGPLFGGSSPSADLQQSLASKLRVLMDVNGSPEYTMIWKQWDMFAGLQICALRASARRTSGSDCGGWPTVSANEDAAGTLNGEMQFMLSHAALTANPTAIRKQLTTPEQSGGPAATEKQGEFLPDGAQTAGYPTPNTMDHLPAMEMEARLNHRSRKARCSGNLREEVVYRFGPPGQAETAGYPTPQEDNANNSMGHKGTAFSDLPTTAMDAFKMPDMTGWKLNPAFSGWLMGYPKAWMEAGLRAMQNCSRSRKASKGVSDCSKATETR